LAKVYFLQLKIFGDYSLGKDPLRKKNNYIAALKLPETDFFFKKNVVSLNGGVL
jgi:hypothetical protein